MATWQPPIPAGALYSKPARALGPALALLAYCYDLVQRDGWLEIVLKDAAGDMGEPYPNVKRWWQALQDGNFFAQMEDHGRKGWRVRFKDVWIDWRILEKRGPSRTTEGSEMILDDAEGQLKDISSTNESSEMILETSGNKVLISTDQARDPRTKIRAPPSGHQQLMAAYQEALGYKIPKPAKEAAAAKRILSAGYTPEQAIEVYCTLKVRNFYSQQHLSLHTVYEQMGAILNGKASKNGSKHIRQSPNGHSERGTLSEADPERGF